MQIVSKLFCVTCLAVFCLSCNPTEESNNNFTASIAGDSLNLLNNSNNLYYYMVMGQKFSTYADWETTCSVFNSISANSSKMIAISDIGKDSLDNTLNVYYWQKESDNSPCSSNILHFSVKFR